VAFDGKIVELAQPESMCHASASQMMEASPSLSANLVAQRLVAAAMSEAELVVLPVALMKARRKDVDVLAEPRTVRWIPRSNLMVKMNSSKGVAEAELMQQTTDLPSKLVEPLGNPQQARQMPSLLPTKPPELFP